MTTKTSKPRYLNFNAKDYLWKSGVDYRKHPELYHIGKGEQGVLICEPYKSMIGKHWRFKTPEIAKISSQKIYKMFEGYLKKNDFVGADMARKYLQMGYTRARRYANYKGGKKFDKNNGYALNQRGTGELAKAESAAIFYRCWRDAVADVRYQSFKQAWQLAHKN